MSGESLTHILPRLVDFVAEAVGMHFPETRWGELERAVSQTARELDYPSPMACADKFLSGSAKNAEIEALAAHLTVGETYFMREQKVFDVLTAKIFPEICRRRSGNRILRIWSAACCTGEEAYSIAITLRRAIPDLDQWNVSVLATDINSRYLRKATAGIYGPWSFRQVPHSFRERYFRSVGHDLWEVLPHIRQLVRFAPLNLVSDVYPALLSESNAMDIIFCRNMLMYFTPQQVRKVIGNLHRAQAEGGWLITGGGELSQSACGPYLPEHFDGITVFRKEDACRNRDPHQYFQPPIISVSAPTVSLTPPAPKIPRPLTSAPSRNKHDKLRRAARRLANRGRLSEALACCRRWILADRLDPAAHYLTAVIQQELGDIASAVNSLRTALYLDADFVLAHFTLGNIERNRGRAAESIRHLETAARLLERFAVDEIVPESEGVTRQRLGEIISSLLEIEVAA